MIPTAMSASVSPCKAFLFRTRHHPHHDGDRPHPDPRVRDGQRDSQAECQTVAALLPAELLLSILSLCQPVPHLPATCQAFSAGFSTPGNQPHRIWLHHQVFDNPEHDPRVVNRSRNLVLRHHEINTRYPLVAQIESRLSYYLKAHAPRPFDDPSPGQSANGLAPEPGTHVLTTIFSATFVQWLFGSAGPFWKQRRRPVATNLDLVQALERIRPTDVFATRTWRLMPDALLLAPFFIRTAQLDLLDVTLTHLRSLFPTSGTDSAPFSTWCRLMLDDRSAYVRSQIVRSYGNLHMTFPGFLCFLALIDWSMPCIHIISRVFSDTFDVSTAVQSIAAHPAMVEVILRPLDQLTSPPSAPARVLDILHWLREINAPINTRWTQYEYISHHIRNSYPIFAAVLRHHDARILPHVSNKRLKQYLGSLVAQWIEKTGQVDLLDVALEHDLFSEDATRARVVRHPALAGDQAVQLLVGDARGLDDGELKAAVFNALKLNFAHSPSTYVSLFNLLASRTINAMDLVLDHWRLWSYSDLSDMLFSYDAADLHFTWDYQRILAHHLRCRSKWQSKISPATVAFTAKLLECCVAHDGMDWDELDAAELATACAMRLLTVAEMVGGETIRIMDKGEMDAIDFVASKTAATVTADSGFSHLIPGMCRNLLGAAVANAAALTPPRASPCTCPSLTHTACDLSHPLAAHNVLITNLLALDRPFVLASIPTKLVASVRVWSQFDAHEIAEHLYWHRALSLLRNVVEPCGPNVAANVAVVVDGLPRVIVESEAFALGVDGLMRRYPEQRSEFVNGLEQSRWEAWAERVAGAASSFPMPEGND